VVKSSIKLVALTVFAALIAVPLAHAGGDPRLRRRSARQGKKAKRSSLDDTTSTAAYRTAYETLYDRNHYSKPPRWRTAGRRPRLLTVSRETKRARHPARPFLQARLP